MLFIHALLKSLYTISSQAFSLSSLALADCPGSGKKSWKSIARSDDEIAAPDSDLNFFSTIW